LNSVCIFRKEKNILG